MTINLSNNNPRVNYTATSGQTAFTIPFDYFDDGDISVYQNGTLKTITTHYTISGSTMTLVTGATVGDKIAITRDVPLERTTDLTSTYSAASINSQLDTIVAQIADLDDRVSRSISLNDYEVGVSLDLPATADRLGKTIQFNSSTGALEVGPSGDELTSLAGITSDITTVAGVASDLSTVATAASNINAVGLNISKVVTVSNNISTILSVNSNISDIRSVADSITDINDIADSIDQVELVAGSISNVDTVALANSNISTVAGDINNINTVAGLSANITTVAGITGAISTVNSNAADITSVSNNIDDVNDVANVITKVTTVADNISNVNTLSSQASNIGTLAGISGSINSLGGISSDITTLAAVASEIGDAATNAASALSAKTAAESARDATLAAFDSFDDRYLGAKTADPSVDNDGNALVGGALYYNTTDEVMKVYTGSVWVAAYASLSGALLVDSNLSDLNNVASARTNLGLGTAATTASTDYVAVTGDSMTGNLSFGDNDKAIFGAGSDLQIYHDGSNSYVKDAGTGDLKIQGANVRLENPSGVRYFQGSSGVSYLYNTGDIKLNTTSTGIDVTGTVTADGLTVQADIPNVVIESTNAAGEAWKLKSTYNNTGGAYGSFQVRDEANNIWMRFNQNNGSDEIDLRTTNLDRLNIANNGDISFYEDTGTTAKFFWDASAESLGIGTSSPSYLVDAQTSSGNAQMQIKSGSDLAQLILTSTDTTGNSQINFADADSNNVGMLQYFHSDNHMEFTVNSAEAMRIDSSGRVGIGTSSPTRQLTVSNSGAALLLLESTGNDNGQLLFGDSASGTVGKVGYAHSTNHMFFHTNGTERMRIDSSGNVGIGTSSPSAPLQVQGSAGEIRLQRPTASQSDWSFKLPSSGGELTFYDNNNAAERMRITSSGSVGIGTSSPSDYYATDLVIDVPSEGGMTIVGGTTDENYVMFADGTADLDQYRGYIGYSHASNYLRFGSNGTEAFRLDASGNLLVGKTSSSSTVQGIALKPNGQGVFTSDGGTGALFNRLTSDGDILEFRKDGTTVGSIESYAGVVTGMTLYPAGNVGFRGATNEILPFGNGSDRDNSIDLGDDNARWRHLYLSGGVYLGGTGAANKLDDYEVGTWTPTISSGTFTAQEAVYTKVGNLVTLCCRVDTFSDVTSSNPVTIGGIPFSRKTGTSGMGSSIAQNVSDVNKQTVYMQAANIVFYGWNSGGYSKLPHSGLNSGAQIYLSVTYTTD